MTELHALEMLGKHFQLLRDIVQVEVSEEMMATLVEGRQRNAEDRRLREEQRQREGK